MGMFITSDSLITNQEATTSLSNHSTRKGGIKITRLEMEGELLHINLEGKLAAPTSNPRRQREGHAESHNVLSGVFETAIPVDSSTRCAGLGAD